MLKQVQHDTPFITQHCTLRYQVASYWPQHCALRYQVVRIVSMRKATGHNIVPFAIRLWSSGRNIVRFAISVVVYRPQHCLYFLPLPHGHGSLRPTFGVVLTTVTLSPRLFAAIGEDAALAIAEFPSKAP